MTPQTNAAERAVQAFHQANGRPPTTVVRAPGRVNLIGEHTDYNDGFVLPLALPYGTAIALEPTDEAVIDATSEGFGQQRIELEAAIDPGSDWAVYLHGMAKLLSAEGFAVGGWRGTLATDIPAGAGLSSSAALEVAAGLAALVSGGVVDPSGGRPPLDLLATIAAIGTRVENEVLGLPSGIMDQLISATAADGSALLIDCATASGEAIPVPDDALVVVLDTGTRRQLVDSEFAARRADCARAAARLGVASLRQADPDAAEQLSRLGADDVLVRRVRHVLGENERTLQTAAALSAGNVEQAGQLMTKSHRSLAEDYEVSSLALDVMVQVAIGAPGCLGARLTGGGFAGCAVALVRRDQVDAFQRHVIEHFTAPAEQPPSAPTAIYAVRPSEGATATSPASAG